MNKLKHFFMLTFSTLLIAFGTYFFKFTNYFTFGGITGLAVLIAKTVLISAGDFNFMAKHNSSIGSSVKGECIEKSRSSTESETERRMLQ